MPKIIKQMGEGHGSGELYPLLKALLIDLAAQKVLIDELTDDHATARTEIVAIGTTLASVKAIHDAHTHECPGSSYTASRCSTPDTGAAENSLAASAASAVTDTSGSSVPAAMTAIKTALTVTS